MGARASTHPGDDSESYTQLVTEILLHPTAGNNNQRLLATQCCAATYGRGGGGYPIWVSVHHSEVVE